MEKPWSIGLPHHVDPSPTMLDIPLESRPYSLLTAKCNPDTISTAWSPHDERRPSCDSTETRSKVEEEDYVLRGIHYSESEHREELEKVLR